MVEEYLLFANSRLRHSELLVPDRWHRYSDILNSFFVAIIKEKFIVNGPIISGAENEHYRRN